MSGSASIPLRPGMTTSSSSTSGPSVARPFDRLVGVRCLADDFEIGLALEQLVEPGAHEGVVVADENANGIVTPAVFPTVASAGHRVGHTRVAAFYRTQAEPSCEPIAIVRAAAAR